ncbi:MAG: glycosyltransferase [Geminicoccaceae bacterium]
MAEPTPTVSVIIIFLNPSAAFLDEAIASVRAQTLADWELLLVDDGSSDDSSEAARAAAAAKPDRVRYLEHPDHANCGMSASRNLGIGAARGRYLTFLDADDVYLPERLAHQVALLDDHPEVGMVYGPTLYWHSWRPDAPGRDAVSRLGLPVGVPLDPPRVMRAFLETHGGIVPGICSLTVRRDAALAVGCFEAAFRGCYEDQVFLSKICTNRNDHAHRSLACEISAARFILHRPGGQIRRLPGAFAASDTRAVSALAGRLPREGRCRRPGAAARAAARALAI